VKEIPGEWVNAYCILNNLIVYDILDVMASLNTFEKIFIQKLRHFKLLLKWELLLTKNCLKGKQYKKKNFSFITSLRET